MKSKAVRGALATSTAIMLFASKGYAQEAPAIASEASAESAGADQAVAGEGEVIIVTGQKRAENVQDVPKQVAIASQEQLTVAGVTRLTELQNIFPTITPTSNAFYSQNPGIRGIAPIASGGSASIGVPSQTAIVVDDFPQATFSTLANELTDVERIEVFAGPQSTLSGRNAASGLINIVTQAPSNQAAYELHVEQTSDEQTRASVFATGPVSSTVAVAVSGFYNRWQGVLHNAQTDEDLLAWNTKGIRGKIRWQPNDTLRFLLAGYYVESKRDTGPILTGANFVVGPDPSNVVYLFDFQQRPLTQLYPGIDINSTNRDVYTPELGDARTKDRGLTFRGDLEIDNLGTLSSLTGYTVSDQPRTDIFIGFPTADGSLSANEANLELTSKHFTQEFRLTSQDTGPFTYVAGAIYSDTRLHFPYERLTIFPVQWDRHFNTESLAVFGRGTLELGPRDSVTAGLRYQHDKLSYDWTFFPLSPTDPDTVSEGSSTHGFLAGEISYKHDFSDDVNAYVTYAQTESGEAYDLEDNAAASVGELEPLTSPKARSWEAGIKAQMLDGRLVINFDIFYLNYKNFQFSSIDLGDPGDIPVIRLLSVGKVRSQGAELISSFRATRDLRLNLSGSYTDAQIISYPGAACWTGQTEAQGCVDGQQNIDGLSLPATPKWKFTAGADYVLPLEALDVNFGAFYRYQSAVHYAVLGDPLSYQDGYGTLNLYVGPSSKDGTWSVQAFVNNVFNKHYYSGIGRVTLHNTFDPPGAANLASAAYDRGSFRYAGIRADLRF